MRNMITKLKMTALFCLCFVFVVNTQAALEVLQNPYNMEIAYYQTAGIENWPDWDTDTLETAYDAGQVTMTSGTVDLGNKLYAVDGLAPDYGSVLTTTMKLASGAWINYKFNAGYTGGRTLGSETQSALRVNTFYHEDMKGFHYKLLYSTTDAPNTFHVLVEVRDLSVIAWQPRTITYDFGENSTRVRNVDTIRYEELHTSSPGAIVEFNASLILEPVTAQVDLLTQISTVPSLYNVGYNGWGDIYRTKPVGLFNDVNVKHLRIEARLSEICGPVSGSPLDLDYTIPEDGGVGFVDRINVAIANGWIPLIALSIHSAVDRLPVWFYGEMNDSNGDAWTRYNSDGTKSATLAGGNQLQEMSDLCQQIAAGLVARGITGLLWETDYELGHTMPLPAIHYNNASGIHQADATAKFMGPATWPNWTVEEVFLKPYLLTYGADLLDYVSIHWYANLGLFSNILTMADTTELSQLMDIIPNYGQWCKDIKAILDNPSYNPSGKQIGIAYSEFDVTSTSPYANNPENVDWPDYRADADCYINTNYFGGVWCASTLCHLAESNSLDIAFKYLGRSFYGVLGQERVSGEYFETPLWHAWKLLQTKASLVEGSPMFQTQVLTPLDSQVAVFAVGDLKNPRIILINHSFDSQIVDLTIEGLGGNDKTLIANRYIFNEDRSARWIGRQPGTSYEGGFEHAPADSPRNIALERVDDLPLTPADSNYNLQLECGPISITVLQIAAVGDFDADGDVDISDFALLVSEWIFEKQDFYIENHSFEYPEILDGYSYSIAPDDWVRSGFMKLYDPSQAQWDGFYSSDINTLDGDQMIYATGGGIYQDTGIIIQPETVYEISVDTGLPLGLSGDALIKLMAVDGAIETDLLTVAVDSSSEPAGQGRRLFDGLWVTQTASWDSSEIPAVTGQPLRVYIGGNQIHADTVRLTNGDCLYDLNDDGIINIIDFSEFSKNWMREIGDNL